MKQQTILIGIVCVALGVGGGFLAGQQHQKNLRPGVLQGQFQRTSGGQINRPLSGNILSIDEHGVTIKQPDGSTKIVIISVTTTISKAERIEKSTLQKGDEITVFGMQTPEGAIDATQITVGGMMMGQRRGAQENK